MLAIETIGQNRSRLPWGILTPVESSLLKAVQSSRERNRFTQQAESGQAYFIDEVAISPDGKMIATNIWGGGIYLWSLEGQQIAQLSQDSMEVFTSISFGADGKTIIASDSMDFGRIKFWDVSGRVLPLPFKQTLTSFITAATFTSGGRRIITGDSNGQLRIWDTRGNPLSSDGSQIATVNDPEVCLWQLKNDALTKQSCKQIAEPRATVFSSDSRFLGIGNDRGVLYLWNLNNNQLLPGLQIHSSSINAIAFSPDNKKIVSGDLNGSIQLSTTQTTYVGELNSLQSFNSIISLAFSPDGNAVISSSSDGAVRRYSTRWQDWLTVECDRLRHHPVLENPTTDE